MAQLGVYFLLDTSASMYGVPVQVLHEAYAYFGRTLNRYPNHQFTFSVVCYDNLVTELCRCQPQLPALVPISPAGTSHLGGALAHIHAWLVADLPTTTHILVVVIADDVGNDDWRAECQKLSALNAQVTLIAIACEQKNRLHDLCDAPVFSLKHENALESWLKQFMGQRF